MSNAKLTLRQNNSILTEARNQVWDLHNKQPGFIIQLHVHHQVIITQQQQDQNNAAAAATTCIKPDTFFYFQDTFFMTHDSIFLFLSKSLADEGVKFDVDGRFLLSDGGLLLLRHDTSRMLTFLRSLRVYTLANLAECVLTYAKYLKSTNKGNRFRKFVPVAMYLTVVRYQRFLLRGVDDNNLELIMRSIEEANCAICLDRLAVGELASCTPCSHTFHKKCIARWLLVENTRSSCPLCRADLFQIC